jgi:DNA polymerase-3 subunit delta
MGALAPHIYLLNGDDEYAITQFITNLVAEKVDPASAAMNLIRLDGKTQTPEEIFMTAGAMPFLSGQRVVIVDNPTAQLKPPPSKKGKPQPEPTPEQDRFLERLGKIPPTTTLVMAEYKFLTEYKKRKENKLHWLEKWAVTAGEGVALRAFSLPKSAEMPHWIQEKVKKYGGSITRLAAEELASLVDENPRLADQEIQKLLTYVNFQRPIEQKDIELLTTDMAQGDIFALTDALGNLNGQSAMEMLQRQLERKEPLEIFSMIVRQFRLLIQVRELMDQGKRQDEIIKTLKISPFLVGKLIPQAKRFNLPALESIYRSLLSLDEAMKTSKLPGALALETLVVQATGVKF